MLIGSSQSGNNLLMRRGGRGDVTARRVAWRVDEASTSFGSPLLHEGRAYIGNEAGVAFAVDLQKQKLLWKQRLPDPTRASDRQRRQHLFPLKGWRNHRHPIGGHVQKNWRDQLTVKDRVYALAVSVGGLLLRSGRRLTFIQPTADGS